MASNASIVVDLLWEFLGAIYGIHVERQEQVSMADQRPVRFLSKNDSRVLVWEDKGWKAFERHAPGIVRLAQRDEGKALVFAGREEHSRAILYKVFGTLEFILRLILP